MKMTTDRTTKVLLALVAVALWGTLLRPLFVAGPAKAQVTASAAQQGQEGQEGQEGSPPLKPPIILQAQEGIPYVVLSDGYISVWYLDTQIEKLDRKTITERKLEENTVLIRADAKPLPTR